MNKQFKLAIRNMLEDVFAVLKIFAGIILFFFQCLIVCGTMEWIHFGSRSDYATINHFFYRIGIVELPILILYGLYRWYKDASER